MKEIKIRHIVIITDCKDVAFCEMRRQILLECEKLGNYYTVVEPLVPAEEFSIINGAFLARLMADHYRENVLFMLILNPLQKRPKRIFGKISDGVYFEGADTGALNWLLKDFGLASLYEITEKKFYAFGGKYVHSPVVAKMASGIPFRAYGKRIEKNKLNKFFIPDGAVVHIDNFGLMKIKGKPLVYKEGEIVNLFVNGKKSVTAVVSERMMNHKDGTWVLYSGSSMGLPELGKVRCKDGARELNVKVGDILTWKRI